MLYFQIGFPLKSKRKRRRNRKEEGDEKLGENPRGSEGVDDGAPRRLGALRTSSFDLRSYDGHRLSPWGYNRISPKSQFSPPANQFEPSRSEPEDEEEEEEEPAAAAEEEHNELQKMQV
ncbi:hypothetical protein RUM43_008907 [Polyplax serrata]|uniref:Uncharacterized protein n=1 Tax=Polyplax serrata TaxID=468196 RepID=A0AAN8NUG0_POLSC